MVEQNRKAGQNPPRVVAPTEEEEEEEEPLVHRHAVLTFPTLFIKPKKVTSLFF